MPMLPYSIIMFSATALFGALGIAIYKGKTNLIHDYHQTKARNKAAYGKAFGKALFRFALAPLLSGIVGLFADTKIIGMASVAVLIIGSGIGIGCIVAVQNKYNNGVF